jgi:hypothetical protein
MATASSASLAATKTIVIVLTVITAAVHFTLLFPDPVFTLNALGYLALLGALMLPIPQLAGRRRVVRLALAGYAALTILFWVAIGERTALGYLTTLDEVALVALLLLSPRLD